MVRDYSDTPSEQGQIRTCAFPEKDRVQPILRRGIGSGIVSAPLVGSHDNVARTTLERDVKTGSQA